MAGLCGTPRIREFGWLSNRMVTVELIIDLEGSWVDGIEVVLLNFGLHDLGSWARAQL